jgi:shikimate kinase
MEDRKRIVLTGFMGVGKSSVGRHLAHLLGCERTDLDSFIESNEQRTIAEIIAAVGEANFRQIESAVLSEVLGNDSVRVLSLGGGAWTIEKNRKLIKDKGFTSVWLESSFEHCWRNISFSKKVRPLAKNKSTARKLFEERKNDYCLADWHFAIRPEYTSHEIARRIYEEFFV